jgi:predicted RNase H-like nuclease (RuvC/YqgF family)
MSATISPLPSRPSDGVEVLEAQDRKTIPLQSLEAGPARDSFVAQTAIKIEQLQANVRIMTRKLEELTGKVRELQEACALEDRWYGFHQSEKRASENKLDGTTRSCRDLKARLDHMEARSGGDYHAYTSFEAVSRKLGELERTTMERTKRKDAFRPWLLPALLIAALTISGLVILPIS